MRACVCLILAAIFAAPAWALDVPRSYPDDPFFQERAEQKPMETGTARGQTHITALGSLVSGKNSEDIYLGGQLGIEFVLHEFGGIRITGFQDLFETDGDQLAHKFSSVRVGPALHLRPYRRIDLGPFAEGGLLVVDAVDGRGGVTAPEATLGGFITVYINSFAFVQLELERSWSNVDIDQVFRAQDRTAAMMGLGIAF